MRTSEADILIVPGLGGSGPDHWQTRWENKLSTARRVSQADWERPVLTHWIGNIAAAVQEAARPVLLVGHSLGVHAVAHAAPLLDAGKVRGAFLVAPPSVERLEEIGEIDRAFLNVPNGPLPFPSLLVASRNDPFADYRQAEDLAYAWGSAIVDAGEAGHINAESGHGPWPEGLMRFGGFLAKI